MAFNGFLVCPAPDRLVHAPHGCVVHVSTTESTYEQAMLHCRRQWEEAALRELLHLPQYQVLAHPSLGPLIIFLCRLFPACRGPLVDGAEGPWRDALEQHGVAAGHRWPLPAIEETQRRLIRVLEGIKDQANSGAPPEAPARGSVDPVKQPVEQPVEQSVDQSVHRSVEQSVDRSVDSPREGRAAPQWRSPRHHCPQTSVRIDPIDETPPPFVWGSIEEVRSAWGRPKRRRTIGGR